MRRGFKTTAEKVSHEIRAELGLTPRDRLDPFALATHLAIPVQPVTGLIDHGADPVALECVLEERMRFSAVTVFRGTRCGIFYNPHHSAGRRANSIAHEISHVILEHTPGPAVTQDGLRNWNAQQEDEADWQSGALLVPRDGALHWMANEGGYGDGAAHFGVSTRLFRWRVQHTGVERQLRARVRVS